MDTTAASPRMPGFWQRLWNPFRYHQVRAEQLWQITLLREAERWRERYEDYRGAAVDDLESWLASNLPDLSALLAGTVQPADFVKRWGMPQTENVAAEGKLTDKTRPEVKRGLFDLAVAQSDIYLRGEEDAAADLYLFRVTCLFTVCLLTVMALVALGLSPQADNAVAGLGDLAFAGILLVPPTVSLFVYSRLMHAHYLHRWSYGDQRTRLAAATHAYETYEEIRRMQERLRLKETPATAQA